MDDDLRDSNWYYAQKNIHANIEISILVNYVPVVVSYRSEIILDYYFIIYAK